MEKIEQLPEPPPKKRKVEDKNEENCVVVVANEILAFEVAEKKIHEIEVHENVAEVQQQQEQEGITENDWAQIEIEKSELIETENGAAWLCKYCEPNPVTFPVLEDFRSHLLSTHLSYEQVGVEEMETENEEVILEEYENEEAIQSDPENKSENLLKELVVAEVYECTHCNYTVGDRSDFKTHQKMHQSTRFERLMCVECSFQFTTQAHFQAHLNGHQLYEIVAKHSNFPICDACNTMFCDENYELLHREKHELGENAFEAIPVIGTFLKYGHYRSDLEVKEIEGLKGDATISCGHCLRRFHDEESCRLHQLIFHITTLKCPIENRVFKGNQAFSIHMKNNHPELFGSEAKFQCSVCKIEFETLYDKLKHMKTCDKKKYACNHCDKKFSQKCYLRNHLRLVSGQSSVVCEICDKVCRDKGDYQIHSR